MQELSENGMRILQYFNLFLKIKDDKNQRNYWSNTYIYTDSRFVWIGILCKEWWPVLKRNLWFTELFCTIGVNWINLVSCKVMKYYSICASREVLLSIIISICEHFTFYFVEGVEANRTISFLFLPRDKYYNEFDL